MLRILAILALVLLGGSARASVHQITSLPYTASGSYDTLVLAGTKLSSYSDGIHFTGHDLVLDLGTDTLEFGRSGSGNYGIRFSNHCYNIKIIGGTILHGNQSGSHNSAISLSTGHDILIQGTDVIVNGIDGRCISSSSVGPPGIYNFEIDGGDYWNNCHGYDSRCMYDGAAIRLWSNTYGGYGDYHYKIHDINIRNTPGQGMMFQGRDQENNGTKVLLYNNHIICDARNDTYSSYSGTCNSSANPYGIALLKGAPGSRIYNNTIVSGNNYGGGRGILIENTLGEAGNWVEVYDNYVDVHEGPNVEYGEGGTSVHALRVRAIDGLDIDYIKIYNNTFIGTGDANTSTDNYNRGVATLRYSDSYGTDNIVIENNTFRAKSLTSGVESLAAVFDYANSGGLKFKGNRIEGDGTLVKFGYNNSGAKNICIEGGTLSFLSPVYDAQTYHIGHLRNNWDCSNNSACDVNYENGADDKDITLALGGNLEFELQNKVTVNVKGYNNLPVPSASVKIINNYGRNIINNYTLSSGSTDGKVTYLFEQRIGSDSLYYNPFRVIVKKGNDSTVQSFEVNGSPVNLNIVLENTAGEDCDDCDFICGDLDKDTNICLLDMIFLVNYLYKGGPAPDPIESADVNSDGSIDFIDLIHLRDYIYMEGNPPSCP